jgi:hypothetical protein
MTIVAPFTTPQGGVDVVTGYSFKLSATVTISSIALQTFGIVRYTFSGQPDLRQFRKGNFITFVGCDNVLNDGTFELKSVDYDNFWFEVLNPNGVADADGGGTVDLSTLGHALATIDISRQTGSSMESSVAPAPFEPVLPLSAPTQVKKTVGVTAIKLCAGASKLASRKKLLFQPVEESGTPKFFLGSSTVTTSGATQGLELFPSVLYEFEDQSEWYIISDTAAQSVVVIEQA